MWVLTYSFEGKKRTVALPKDVASKLAPLIEKGRLLREAVMEVLAINLQLLDMWRQEQPRQRGLSRP